MLSTDVIKTTVLFDCPVPPWVVLAGAGAALVAIVVFILRDSAHLRALVRLAIVGLVFLALVMLTGILLGPRIIIEKRDPQKPLCTVLVDGSQSMRRAEAYDEELTRWIESVLPARRDAAAANVTREELVRVLLKPDPEGWLAGLREGFDLRGLRFAKTLDALPLDREPVAYRLAEDGKVTELGTALEEGAKAVNRRRPRAMVVLSDGAWNSGEDPSAVARVLGRMGVPVFVIGFGNPSPPKDAKVIALDAPAKPLLGDEILLTAEVATTGMGAVRLPVTLTTGTGEAIAEKHVVTLPSGRPVKVKFTFVPDTPGRRVFRVVVPLQDDEQDEGNNVASATVDVAERTIRALLVEGEPRWEFRFIRNIFERDPAVEPTIHLQRPGIGPVKGEGYLSQLPVEKKDLMDFDLVVLGDVPRDRLPDEFVDALAEFVRLRGGALIVVAGRRRNYRTLAGTPVADILPVSLDGTMGGDERGGSPFGIELTQDGATHLVTRLAPDPEENESLWARLPRVRWSAAVGALARGATALVVHPYRLAGAAKLPIIAVQRVGAGKVLFSGIEGTWRWRKALGDKHQYRFWAQTVRWMVKKQFTKGDPRARLSLDRAECDTGEAVEIEAYCLGPDGFPLEGARVWVRIHRAEGGKSRRLAMAPVRGGWGIYRAVWRPKEAGQFTMVPIVSDYGDQPLSSSVALEVKEVDLEDKFLAQDLNTLSAIAQASGGQYLRVDESARLPGLVAAKVERPPNRDEYSPCRNKPYYAMMALLLGAAWFIRKRSGLA